MKRYLATRVAAGEVTLVPISNQPGIFATIDTPTWGAWKTSGRSTTWFLAANGRNSFYVRFRQRPSTRGLGTVARDLVGAELDEIVQYRDGNPLNLCGDNLFVVSRTHQYPSKKHIRFGDVGPQPWQQWIATDSEGLPRVDEPELAA